MNRLARVVTVLTIPALACGCFDRPVARDVIETTTQTSNTFIYSTNRKLDLLFIIDDSSSMEREQGEIVTNFHRMIEELEQLAFGLPDLHLGVVSTNVGAGDLAGGCDIDPAEAGALRNQPADGACSGLRDGDRFLIDHGAGGTRNYDGELEDAFACIAELGTGGCGFEQPLEAMRLALAPDNPINRGFLRDDAALAVIFLTDEDDCSTFDPAMFGDDPALGPLESFRCFEHGVTCDSPADPRALGDHLGCTANPDSLYLTSVTEYVDFLRGLKPDRLPIIVAGIMGAPALDGTVTVQRDAGGVLEVAPTCAIGLDDPQGARPPVRLDAFLGQFAGGIRASICDRDLGAAIAEIGNFIREALPLHCVPDGTIDVDPDAPGLQVECVVTAQGTDQPERTVPRCAGALPDPATGELCWTIEPHNGCDDIIGHEIVIQPRDPDGTTIIRAACVGS